MRALGLLVLPLLLAACDRREVVAICAAQVTAEAEVVAALHEGDGRRAVLISDGAAGTLTLTETRDAAAILGDLWRLAEPTMRALREDEPSPCGAGALSYVIVRFDDGSATARSTTCTGNALSRVATGVLDRSDVAAAREGAPVAGAPVAGLAEACEALR